MRERFERRVVRGDDGCWSWVGGHDRNGYAIIGATTDDGRRRPHFCHRVAYEMYVGPITEGMVVTHSCQNRGCINPQHLELVTPGRPTATLRERFERRVVRGPGCWSWVGHHDVKGYSIIGAKVGGGKPRPHLVHRVAYELLVGPIPEGLVISHSCRNVGCINPEHLELVPPGPPVPPPGRACSIEGCGKDYYIKGLCNSHYLRLRRFGDPLGSGRKTLSQRIESQAVAVEGGCWQWTGCCFNTGYGSIKIMGRPTQLVHRVAYELYVGPIPDGLTIDHLCYNTRCINPAHLEPVTQCVNTQRAFARRRAIRAATS